MITQLTATYFVGMINIPRITGSAVDATARMSLLNNVIAVRENEYLKLLLGDDLYAEFAAAVDAVENTVPPGVLPNALSDKWKTLYNLLYYTSNLIPFSPAAYYVYFYFTKHVQTITMPNGEGKATHENAVVVSAKGKMVESWNQMAAITLDLAEYLSENVDVYNTYSDEYHDKLESINPFGI